MYGYVECIRDDFSWLTKGKIYKIECMVLDLITVKNNIGELKNYPSDIFRRLTKCEVDHFNAVNKGVFDNKTKPTYYGKNFDVIDFCQKNNLDFMQGNVIKYVTRYKKKNGKEDLLKAKEYIDRMIKEMED